MTPQRPSDARLSVAGQAPAAAAATAPDPDPVIGIEGRRAGPRPVTRSASPGGLARRPVVSSGLVRAAAAVALLVSLVVVVAVVTTTPLGLALATLAGWLVAAASFGASKPAGAAGFDVPVRAGFYVAASAGIIATVLGIPRTTSLDVIVVAATASGGALGLAAIRHWRRGPVRVLVVGEPEATATAFRRWSDRRDAVVVGLCDLTVDGDAGFVHRYPGAPLTEGYPDITDAVGAWKVDLVLATSGASLGTDTFRRLGWRLEHTGVDLGMLDETGSLSPHRVSVTGVGDSTVVSVAPPRPRMLAAVAKIVLDRSAGLLLLALVSPVMGLAALAIRLDSPGPALFRQTRIGRYGRPFTILKLRTMTTDAEDRRGLLSHSNESDAVLFKIRRDPRVTRMGRLLRVTSLDELPQLLNVVRGEMSLVGPRPALPEEVALYDEATRRRLAVKPGLTGLWQVSGRSDLAWERAVALDLHYTDNITVGGDLAICLRTLRAVLRRDGAY